MPALGAGISQAYATGQQLMAARLGPIDLSLGIDAFIFHFTMNRGDVTRLAPKTTRRTYSTVYADVPIALSDHVPKEWKANNSVDIQIEFEIVGEGNTAIDSELRKLRRFMRKTRKTGEPPDLLYVMGRKQWAVRLDRMEVQAALWNYNADEQRAKVTLTMHTIRPED